MEHINQIREPYPEVRGGLLKYFLNKGIAGIQTGCDRIQINLLRCNSGMIGQHAPA
ncbi:hypothetical protein D3C84_1171010 [compost metagenome]